MSNRRSSLVSPDELLSWAQQLTRGYPGVDVVDLSSSFADGRALLALLHRYFPDVVPVQSFTESESYDRVAGFELALRIARVRTGCPPWHLEDAAKKGGRPLEKVCSGGRPEAEVTTYLTLLRSRLKNCTPSEDPPPATEDPSSQPASPLTGAAALDGKKLSFVIERAPGAMIGLSLNRRNRIAAVDKGSPAAAAGLCVLDRVLAVDGAAPSGSDGVARLLAAGATTLRLVVERPPKSRRKAIIAEENAHERAAEEAETGRSTDDDAGESLGEHSAPVSSARRSRRGRAMLGAAAGEGAVKRSRSLPTKKTRAAAATAATAAVSSPPAEQPTSAEPPLPETTAPIAEEAPAPLVEHEPLAPSSEEPVAPAVEPVIERSRSLQPAAARAAAKRVSFNVKAPMRAAASTGPPRWCRRWGRRRTRFHVMCASARHPVD